jgi:anti-sigma-K factor RskA
MPDVVSRDDLDALAAEYVLGTLDYEERKGAAALLEVDHSFRGTVRIWERRLGELHLMVEPVEPDGKVWERIKAKVAALALEADLAAAGVTEPVTSLESPVAEASPDALAPPEPSAEAEAEAEAEAGAPVAPDDSTDTAMNKVESEPAPGAETIEPSAPKLTGPEATANLIRELEEAARLVSSTQATAVVERPPPLIPREEAVEEEAKQEVPRPLRRWRLLAVTMSLVAVALASLIGAWRFIPDQLPPQLQASTVLHLPVPVTLSPPLPRARPNPPPSFDE